MQITFDPLSPTDRDVVAKILADMSPEAVVQAIAAPAEHYAPAQVPTPAPAPAPAPMAPPAAPAPAPAPTGAPPVSQSDDPLPNPSNVRAPSDVAPVGGTISVDSFRARIQAVGQRAGMDQVKDTVAKMGYEKLNQIPEAEYINILTMLEALEA